MLKKISHILFLLFLANILSAQNTVNISLIARNTGQKVLANQDTVRVFGFATSLSVQPNVPGPTIIAQEGDSVHIDVWNVSQGAPHTIHLHGLDVDQQNDGVPHLSFDIPHMQHGYYHFKAPHAGTYLYHCHVASTIHVQAGMYGLIIIKPTNGGNMTWNGGYDYIQEKSFMLSEIDTNWHTDSVLLHDHDTSVAIHILEILDYKPQFFLINGFSDNQLVSENQQLTAAVNEVDYIRLANIGFYGVRVIFPANLNAKIIDSDGRPFTTVELSDTVMIHPGERYGVLVESFVEFQDQIKFEYFDLNTQIVANTQLIPVTVSGFLNLDKNASTTSFELVPNPFTQELGVFYHSDIVTEVSIEIFDVQGRIVVEKIQFACTTGDNQIEIGKYLKDKGQYLIKVTTKENQSEIKKAIKF